MDHTNLEREGATSVPIVVNLQNQRLREFGSNWQDLMAKVLSLPGLARSISEMNNFNRSAAGQGHHTWSTHGIDFSSVNVKGRANIIKGLLNNRQNE